MSEMRARRISMMRKGCGTHVVAITCCGRPPVSQLVLIYASPCTYVVIEEILEEAEDKSVCNQKTS